MRLKENNQTPIKLQIRNGAMSRRTPFGRLCANSVTQSCVYRVIKFEVEGFVTKKTRFTNPPSSTC
jgi:hypothetical protein